MLKNYLNITIRFFVKHKVYSFINITGLAIGMACSLLITLWVRDEMSYDQFHTNIDNLYRVMEDQHYSDGSIFTTSGTPGVMAPEMKKDFGEVVRASRITWNVNNLLEYDNKAFFEPTRYVDPDFLLMFSFPLVEGDMNTALDDPKSVIISQQLAEKYFGTQSPIGESIKVNDEELFQITGV